MEVFNLNKKMMCHSKHGRIMMKDCTGDSPVYVFSDGTRMPVITIGGKELPFNFEPLSTEGEIPEVRPHRLLTQFNRSGVWEFTLIFQNQLTSVMKQDLQTGRWYSDAHFSNSFGVKFIGTMEQCSDYWDELIKNNTFVKQDFEKPATPEQCVKYYNNKKNILFI